MRKPRWRDLLKRLVVRLLDLDPMDDPIIQPRQRIVASNSRRMRVRTNPLANHDL